MGAIAAETLEVAQVDMLFAGLTFAKVEGFVVTGRLVFNLVAHLGIEAIAEDRDDDHNYCQGDFGQA